MHHNKRAVRTPVLAGESQASVLCERTGAFLLQLRGFVLQLQFATF